MAGKRMTPHHPFIQFLFDNCRTFDGEPNPLTTIKELADLTGKSNQVLSKYDCVGLADLDKMKELVRLCNIDMDLFAEWISSQIKTSAA